MPNVTDHIVPRVEKPSKIAVWKGPDGSYHESIESIRKALTTRAIMDFANNNNITECAALAEAIAPHLSNIHARIEEAL